MKLTHHQREALSALAQKRWPEFRTEQHAQGFRRTLNALERRGLVRWDRSNICVGPPYGWRLTQEGEDLSIELGLGGHPIPKDEGK